jgi:hypothetical protein
MPNVKYVVSLELIKLASLALLLLLRAAGLTLSTSRLIMRRLVDSSQSESLGLLIVGLIWLLGGIVLGVLVVFVALGWLRL